MLRLLALLLLGPFAAQAACTGHDGQAVPAPGIVEGVLTDRTWLPTAVDQYSRLGEADRRSLDLLAADTGAVVLADPCSPIDLLLIHFSALNLAQPDAAAVPEALGEQGRAWVVPAESAPVFPAFLSQIKGAAR